MSNPDLLFFRLQVFRDIFNQLIAQEPIVEDLFKVISRDAVGAERIDIFFDILFEESIGIGCRRRSFGRNRCGCWLTGRTCLGSSYWDNFFRRLALWFFCGCRQPAFRSFCGRGGRLGRISWVYEFDLSERPGWGVNKSRSYGRRVGPFRIKGKLFSQQRLHFFVADSNIPFCRFFSNDHFIDQLIQHILADDSRILQLVEQRESVLFPSFTKIIDILGCLRQHVHARILRAGLEISSLDLSIANGCNRNVWFYDVAVNQYITQQHSDHRKGHNSDGDRGLDLLLFLLLSG